MNDPSDDVPGPLVERCGPGKYAWCRCGASGKRPHCDGTHRGGPTTPLKVVFDEERTVAWCTCGKTAAPPFCDGSHRG